MISNQFEGVTDPVKGFFNRASGVESCGANIVNVPAQGIKSPVISTAPVCGA